MQSIKSGSWRRGLNDSGSSWGRVVPLTGLAGLWLALAFAGCSSDTPNEVGSGLVDTRFDVTLEALGITAIDQYQGKTIADTDLPLASQEVLYLGSQGGNSSSILVNFDFSDIISEGLPAEAFDSNNIQTIKLRFLMLEYYKSLRSEPDPAGKALTKVYEVFSLSAPFESTAFPGLIPDFLDYPPLNTNPVPEESAYLTLPLSPDAFQTWLANASVQGLLIREGEPSEPGLTGFASREMKHGGSTLDPLNQDIVLGPAILVKLAQPDTVIVIPPLADTSTFHELPEAPADPVDGFMLRTCLRSYPIFRFDFSDLPENVFINRAVFYVANDTSSSFGNLQSLVVSEFDMNSIGVPGEALPLADLDGATYSIIGMNNLDPAFNHILQFNVTSAVQRIVNGVYDGERGLIMTAGEDIFPSYDLSSVDPDFFFTQFNFFGAAADDTLRPQLRITYSGMDELTGGGK